MHTRQIKYGKTVRRTTGVTEHAEITMELERKDYEEEAFSRAKSIVNKALADEPLKASIGQLLQQKEQQ